MTLAEELPKIKAYFKKLDKQEQKAFPLAHKALNAIDKATEDLIMKGNKSPEEKDGKNWPGILNIPSSAINNLHAPGGPSPVDFKLLFDNTEMLDFLNRLTQQIKDDLRNGRF